MNLAAELCDSDCLPLHTLPGGSPLFRDLLSNFDRVTEFYDYNPSDPESLLRSAARVDFPDDRRRTICQILEEQNGRSPALERLRRPGTVAILTGQQVGLFGGPCYTVYKALTAISLSHRLRKLGVDAVPVFWMATEDHDFAEVDHCWVFDGAFNPVRLNAGGSGVKNFPVGSLPVGTAPFDGLRDALSGHPYGDEVVTLVEKAYAPGRNYGAAFAALMRQLIGDPDLLFFDPMDSSARQLAVPFVERVVRNGAPLTEAILRRNQDLERAGYHAQVHVDPQTALVFLLEEGERKTLRRHGNDYVAGERTISGEELAARSSDLSPNALLRPVVQDYLFPTAAYVGGPAELAYFAQNQVLYRDLLGRTPMVIPRASATILDKRTADLLADNDLRLPDMHQSAALVRERFAAPFVPPYVATAVGETRIAFANLLDQLNSSPSANGLSDPRWLARSRRSIEYQLSKVEKRIARDRMAKDDRATKTAIAAYNLIYPNGHVQERVYSILPFLAQHGVDLIGRLRAELDSEHATHAILVV